MDQNFSIGDEVVPACVEYHSMYGQGPFRVKGIARFFHGKQEIWIDSLHKGFVKAPANDFRRAEN